MKCTEYDASSLCSLKMVVIAIGEKMNIKAVLAREIAETLVFSGDTDVTFEDID